MSSPSRTTEPAPDGGQYETHTLGGALHREDGPARTTYRPDGSIAREEWFLRGSNYREDGPSDVHYGPDGVVAKERWVYAGELTRADGPALIDHEKGVTAWYAEGSLHRLNGPAFVEAASTYTSDFFYLNGSICVSPEVYWARIAAASPAEFERMTEATEFESLLESYTPEQIQAEIVAGLTTRSGVEQVLEGAPREWVLAWEESQS